jgi:hypothetical protein
MRNGLKRIDTLLPLLFSVSLEYAIRKVQEDQMGLKLNGTYQLMGDDVDTVKKNTGGWTGNKRREN